MTKSDRKDPKSVTRDGAESADAGAGCNALEGQMIRTIYRGASFEGDIVDAGVWSDGDISIEIGNPDGVWVAVALKPYQAQTLAEAIMEATDD